MVELLAPAGSFDALKAAVESGANAVYLAGESFGARSYAENFTCEVMEEAVRFAHLRNVAVHVAVNTVVDDSEFNKLADYLLFLYRIEVDAIIVQDLGVARLAKELVPDLPLHASTQMTIHNLAGVKALEKLGFTRVVLARELNLDDIRYICQNSEAEIEVFVHGALCVCYSGQCLMSSMIGARSGNRGCCAQPCRLPYMLVDENDNIMTDKNIGEYILSPKDLNTIEILPDLIDAGVVSFKIEGRMKRPEYVAVVVDTYRKAIDRIYESVKPSISDEEKKQLYQIFNRDFTTAYLLKKQGKLMISDKRPNNRGLFIGRVVKYDKVVKRVTVKLSEAVNEGDEIDFWIKVGGRISVKLQDIEDKSGNKVTQAQPNDVISFYLPKPVYPHDRAFKVFDIALTNFAQEKYKSKSAIRRISVSIKVTAKINSPLGLKIYSSDGYFAEAGSEILGQKANDKPLTIDILKSQLARMGNTVYYLESVSADIDNNVMFPLSEINKARRLLTEKLDEARLSKYHRKKNISVTKNYQKFFSNKNKKKNIPKIIISTDNIDTVKASIAAKVNGVLFGGESYQHRNISAENYKTAYELCKKAGVEIYFNTPRIIRESNIAELQDLFKEIFALNPDGVYIHNIGVTEMLSFYPLSLIADFSLISFNSYTIKQLGEMGFAKIVLSPELNENQIKNLSEKSSLPLEYIVHGNIELMVSEYCPIGSFLGNIDKKACNMPCVKNSFFLNDRKNERFPIMMDQFCHTHILNSKTLSLLPYADTLPHLGLDSIRIEAKNMTPEKTALLIDVYKKYMGYTGTLSSQEKDIIFTTEGKDITRGHFHRGIV